MLELPVPIGWDARWHGVAPPWRTLGPIERFGRRALRTARGSRGSVALNGWRGLDERDSRSQCGHSEPERHSTGRSEHQSLATLAQRVRRVDSVREPRRVCPDEGARLGTVLCHAHQLCTERFSSRATQTSPGHDRQSPRRTGRVQGVVATRPRWCESSSSLKASDGVFQPRVFRGRRLSVAATAATSLALCRLRSVPLGKYWRSRPLVFSFVPRCHGLRGSQKKTCSPVSIRS